MALEERTIDAAERPAVTASAGGAALALAALAALVVANSRWEPLYRHWLDLRPVLAFGGVGPVVVEPLLFWINDFGMAVFFLLVGLEIKRELVQGGLRHPARAVLPLAAAIGGMIVPALIYLAANHADRGALRGWAIPIATDIAFSLAILTLLGARVPASLKVFLTAVAIVDDLGAIVVIAVFYTAEVALPMLLVAVLGVGGLVGLNRAGVRRIAPYLGLGLVVWVCVLKSGVHPTVAGVLTAFAIPLGRGPRGAASPLEAAEHALRPWVDWLVLPVFAFANAGVALGGMPAAAMVAAVPLGIAAGLVVGKAVGVSAGAWLAMRFTAARLPAGATPRQFFGVAVLCGIGFTMSLFIGELAFGGQAPRLVAEVKLGVLGGSVVSALLGVLLLAAAAPRRPAAP